MNIEEEIFKRRKVDKKKLIKYGFKKEENIYKYSKNFLEDSFRADIVVNERGEVSRKSI